MSSLSQKVNKILNSPIIEFIKNCDSIFYLLDEKFDILYLNTRPWNKFAIENKGFSILEELQDITSDNPLIGSNVISFFDGDKTKSIWEKIFKFSAVNRKELNITYKCPSPTLMRHGLISIYPIIYSKEQSEDEVFMLVKSVIFTSYEQPEMRIYDEQSIIREGQPFITVCSFCKNIKSDTEEVKWLTGLEYYKNGGSDKVNISHGVCNDCLNNITNNLT